MNCEQSQQEVSKLLDNALERERTAELFGHLAVCENCRELFKSIIQIKRAMQNAAPLPMSPGMDEGVLQSAWARPRQAPDQKPIHGWNGHRSLRARISTFALLLMLTLFIGLLFSVNIDKPSQAEPVPQELAQPR